MRAPACAAVSHVSQILPGLIPEELLPAIRAHQLAFLYDRESLPREEQDNHGGPSQIMLDDPTVVGVLNEVLSHQGLASEDCYGFRSRPTDSSANGLAQLPLASSVLLLLR